MYHTENGEGPNDYKGFKSGDKVKVIVDLRSHKKCLTFYINNVKQPSSSPNKEEGEEYTIKLPVAKANVELLNREIDEEEIAWYPCVSDGFLKDREKGATATISFPWDSLMV